MKSANYMEGPGATSRIYCWVRPYYPLTLYLVPPIISTCKVERVG